MSRPVYQNSHAIDYALTICKKDLHSGVVTPVGCSFCISTGGDKTDCESNLTVGANGIVKKRQKPIWFCYC